MDWTKNRILTVIAFLSYVLASQAQVVDESINGIQTGYFGLWVHNESKIAKNWAFRTEVGYESPLISGLNSTTYTSGDATYTASTGTFPIFLPVVSVAPRWYYNSPKRQGNSQNYFHNSSNFAALVIRWYPEFGALAPKDILDIDGGLFITPTWGIRRNISHRINYELGLGVGVDVYELLTSESSTTDVNLNIHVRIGYKFGRKAFQPDY